MPLFLDVLFLALGFYLLAKGADALVEGAATIATKFGMDRWVVGLTVVAWGTSLPEIVVSSMAASADKPGQALGNVLGSNVANAGLVLGTVGLILPRALVGRLSIRESAPLLASLGLLWWMLGDGVVTRVEGAVLLALFIAYTLELILLRGRNNQSTPAELDDTETHATHPWLRTIGGSAAIALAANLVIRGANGLAESFGLDDGFVGIVIFAVGTSLPELAAGVASARKGQAEIGLGNVVGSNVFNTLAVVGIASLVAPFGGPGLGPENSDAWTLSLSQAMSRDLPVNLAFALMLILGPPIFRGRMARPRAASLLAAWIAYAVWIGF
ncbi:MAG: sodium:calcium antiporter [Planctomycetota bacterium]